MFIALLALLAASPDWSAVYPELLRHFQSLVRFDTSDPPGHEAEAAEYLRQVTRRRRAFPSNSSPSTPSAPISSPASRATAPGVLLLMGHTDVVGVQPEKMEAPSLLGHPLPTATSTAAARWATRTTLPSSLMIMLLLKRQKVPLDRDVIFLAEAGEEGSMQYGIAHLVEKHWPLIDAEYCLAEGGGMRRRNGRDHHMLVSTTEKNPTAVKLIARGTAGHGSAPLPDNALERLAAAIARISSWRTPLRGWNEHNPHLRLKARPGQSPEQAARYKALLGPQHSAAAQEYLRLHEPRTTPCSHPPSPPPSLGRLPRQHHSLPGGSRLRRPHHAR
ncbi:MAG: hypothetical protein U0R19_27530 [Bryobacteraceae bacterium]